MSHVNTVYKQLLDLIPRHQFSSYTKMYGGDDYVKYFDCWQQFITLLYAQIRGKDSLRDIEISLKAQSSRWYHIGLRSIKRSTLSDANNRRDYRIYEGLFYVLLSRCKSITPKHKFRFKNPLYSLDATVIDLCLNLFPWAKYMKIKGALRLHYLYDHSGALPLFLVVTDGKRHEISIAKEDHFPIVADSIISIDKGYIDVNWLNGLDKRGVFFVTRLKADMKYEVIGQHSICNKRSILFDKVIRLSGAKTALCYPKNLRLVGYRDKNKKEFVFLTKTLAFLLQQLPAYTKKDGR